MKPGPFFGIILGMTLCLSATSLARPVAIPTFEELWRDAQVVAIIRPLWSTKAPDQLTSAGPRYGPRDPKDFQALNTRFYVSVVLKEHDDLKASTAKEITLLHFRPVTPEVNGGLFMFFEVPQHPPAQPDPACGPETGQHYLAFLMRQKDGRYVPVTGNYDSELSFCKLVKPMFEVMRYFQEDGGLKAQQKTNSPAGPVQPEPPGSNPKAPLVR